MENSFEIVANIRSRCPSPYLSGGIYYAAGKVFGSQAKAAVKKMRWHNLDPRRWKRVAQASPATSESVEVAGEQGVAGGLTTAEAPHLALGRRGEALAALHLENAGYRLVAANFNLPVGR